MLYHKPEINSYLVHRSQADRSPLMGGCPLIKIPSDIPVGNIEILIVGLAEIVFEAPADTTHKIPELIDVIIVIE